MSKMPNMKFRVNSTSHSVEIQTALFDRGCEWGFGGKVFQDITAWFLFSSDGYITKEDSDNDYFVSHHYTEHFLVDGKITSKEQLEKPVIGLRPKHISDSLRIKEILEAMGRYYEAGMKFPQEWVDELSIINSESI